MKGGGERKQRKDLVFSMYIYMHITEGNYLYKDSYKKQRKER